MKTSRLLFRSASASSLLIQCNFSTSKLASVFDRFVGKLRGDKSVFMGDAQLIFHNCKHQSDNKLWQSRGLVGDDFRSKHSVLMLHVWMVHRRLILEGKKGANIQEMLFDQLWEDTSSRIRSLGVHELSVNKRLSEVQGYTFKYCIELDHALRKPTEEEIVEDIGGTVWRSVYNRRPEVAVDHVLEFARYIRKEQLSILQLPAEAVFEGRFDWGSIPWGSASTSGYKGKSRAPSQAGEWKEAMSVDGRVYYWNTATRRSQWEKPKELLEQQQQRQEEIVSATTPREGEATKSTEQKGTATAATPSADAKSGPAEKTSSS